MTQLIEPPQGGDEALADRTGVGAITLHELQVAATAGAADARVHATTLARCMA